MAPEKRSGPSERTTNTGLGDVPETCPPVVGSKQKRRTEDQRAAVIELFLERAARTAAEQDFPAIGDQRDAEYIEDIQPTARLG